MPTVATPSSAAASAMRMAISPRLAIRSLLIMLEPSHETAADRGTCAVGEHAGPARRRGTGRAWRNRHRCARRGALAVRPRRRAGRAGGDPRHHREPRLHERRAEGFLRPLLQSPARAYPGPALRGLHPRRQRRHRHAPRHRDHPDRPALEDGPGAADLPRALAASLRRAVRRARRSDGSRPRRRHLLMPAKTEGAPKTGKTVETAGEGEVHEATTGELKVTYS